MKFDCIFKGKLIKNTDLFINRYWSEDYYWSYKQTEKWGIKSKIC